MASLSLRRERIISEHDAVGCIADGMTIAIGEPHPMALVRHIIRRGLRNLTVIGSGLALDILIAAGCVRKVISYYAGGGYWVPVAPAFRRAAEAGLIEVWECEEGILTSGLEAAGKGLPFLPWRGGVGTSLPQVNPDLKVFSDPINGETLIAVPAIIPDVTLLHAAESDAYGNVRHCGGPGWIDLFLHRAARRTIVQVEKVISNEEIRSNPWATTINSGVDICRMPYGAHPFYSRGYYVQDKPLVAEYFSAANVGGAELGHFLDTYCREPQSHAEYLTAIGIKRLLDLHEY
ncbi:MAG: acyl CoA--acetate/3-ketoacid CoA transferase subunit alpha [Proteobacteria bacterium]|nr:acyl CoA--acetate/3-ketoacid CoA transferase subunit alpha [Pseudomonadota bacterium]